MQHPGDQSNIIFLDKIPQYQYCNYWLYHNMLTCEIINNIVDIIYNLVKTRVKNKNRIEKVEESGKEYNVTSLKCLPIKPGKDSTWCVMSYYNNNISTIIYIYIIYIAQLYVDIKTLFPRFRFQRTTGWVGTVTLGSVINARRRSRASVA